MPSDTLLRKVVQGKVFDKGSQFSNTINAKEIGGGRPTYDHFKRALTRAKDTDGTSLIADPNNISLNQSKGDRKREIAFNELHKPWINYDEHRGVNLSMADKLNMYLLYSKNKYKSNEKLKVRQ